MKVLVTGGTGTVGGEAVKALLQRGAAVRALTGKQPKPGTLRHCLGASRERTAASLKNWQRSGLQPAKK